MIGISLTHCVAHKMTETKAGRLGRERQRQLAFCPLWDGGEKERGREREREGKATSRNSHKKQRRETEGL